MARTSKYDSEIVDQQNRKQMIIIGITRLWCLFLFNFSNTNFFNPNVYRKGKKLAVNLAISIFQPK